MNRFSHVCFLGAVGLLLSSALSAQTVSLSWLDDGTSTGVSSTQILTDPALMGGGGSVTPTNPKNPIVDFGVPSGFTVTAVYDPACGFQPFAGAVIYSTCTTPFSSSTVSPGATYLVSTWDFNTYLYGGTGAGGGARTVTARRNVTHVVTSQCTSLIKVSFETYNTAETIQGRTQLGFISKATISDGLGAPLMVGTIHKFWNYSYAQFIPNSSVPCPPL
jgi:hypothetical protein